MVSLVLNISRKIVMRRYVIAYIVVITVLLSATAVPAGAADPNNPRLLLVSYAINDGSTDTVVPGSFTLNYTLRNTSEIDLENAVLTFSQTDAYIIPMHGRANTEYIGGIHANQDYRGTLTLFVPEDTPTGLHRFEIILNYYPGAQSVHNQITLSYSTFIRISNNPGLDLKQVELSDEIAVGGRRFLYIEYENPGTVDFRNMQLVIEGNITEQQKTQALPILKAGRSNSIEYPVQFTETGIQQIDVYVTYSDDAGNSFQTEVVSKQTDIFSADSTDDRPSAGQRQEGYISRLLNILLRNMRTPAFLLSLVVTAAAIAAITIIIRRIRKQAIRKKWYYKRPDDKKKR